MLAGIWSNQNSYTLPVGMQNDTITLEKGLAVCYKSNASAF